MAPTLPPGFYGSYFGFVNPVDSLKGPTGNTLLNPDINVVAQMAGYAMTTPRKFLGADYGWIFLVPAVNTRFTSDVFNTTAESGGLSDCYFAPIVLGWTKGNATSWRTMASGRPPASSIHPLL